MEIQDLNVSVINPLEKAISNAIFYLQDLEETLNGSPKFHLLSISNILYAEERRPIWLVLCPSSLLENTIAKEVCFIQADLNNLLTKCSYRGHISREG